ncbi:GNAT family N-acetyltransferase [Paenalkalicoccus suaedae]|uniref:GNAT family N-acetyltransferase n=2 Tax=Paenalkalicoccus suaedae TaxID=2592382 RepID=A0A859FK23_9BACI|nr:GNAT family N-acetyltransferase [Paenalkalicoccus suaedae]
MLQYIVDFYEQQDPNEEELEKLIKRLATEPEFGVQFVAEFDGSLVGFSTLYFGFSTLRVQKTATMNDLFVTSRVRGEKIGERLFTATLDYVRDNGYAYMAWETATDNIVAQTLYEKMGGKKADWLFYEIE